MRKDSFPVKSAKRHSRPSGIVKCTTEYIQDINLISVLFVKKDFQTMAPSSITKIDIILRGYIPATPAKQNSQQNGTSKSTKQMCAPEQSSLVTHAGKWLL